MSHFDDLPRRDRNHELEDDAIAAFQSRLAESGAFILQAPDRKDYGTDCQIEVVANGQATNTRIHVQLKGTRSTINADGSLSVEVRRTNLNYLLMQPYSIYIAYHVPTGSLRIRTAESVARQYKHGQPNWTDQHSLTVFRRRTDARAPWSTRRACPFRGEIVTRPACRPSQCGRRRIV